VAINDNQAYRAAATEWIWPVALVLTATPDLGYADDVALEFTLHRGDCTAATILPTGSVTAPFVLRASYGMWKKVVRGLVDPVMAVALKQIDIEGSLSTLMLHAGAAKALVACARTVPTHFPDEGD
jgi:putative sterol carrier protein